MLKTEKTRESNFELLRIIGMLMIIGHHFVVHGGFKFLSDCITTNELFLQFLRIGGKVGVAIFIFISGYFMVSQTQVKIVKLLKLWLQLVIYSVGIYAASCFMGVADFSARNLWQSFFPIIYSKWWFASVYLIIFLFAPYINIVIYKINRKQYLSLIVLMVVFWWLIPTVFRTSMQSNNLILCLGIYCIAGYIKLYPDTIKIKCGTAFLIGSGLYILIFLSNAACRFLSIRFEFFKNYVNHFLRLDSIFVLVAALFIFLSFKELKVKRSGIINTVSLSTFGIYLFHDHPIIRAVLWKRVFHNADHLDSSNLILYACFAVTVVFIVCACVELIRIYLLERLYMKAIYAIEKNQKKRKNALKKT